MKQFFTSRVTVLTLIALVLGAVLLGALVPQTFVSSAKDLELWRASHPALARCAAFFGLHHLYTTAGFAAILLCTFVSLALSTAEQCRRAVRRTCSPPVGGGGTEVRCTIPAEAAAAQLRSFGYLRMGGGNPLRLVRHPWGYWGNTLLHLGMVVTIAASLFIALSQQRGMLHLAEGEVHEVSQPWLSSEQGLVADPLVLADAVRLDRVSPEFWPSYALKGLASFITFLPANGAAEPGKVEVNGITMHGGTRVYQGTHFGHAFLVEVTAPGGARQVNQLLLEQPDRPELPSYNDYPALMGEGSVLRVKYYADAAKASFASENPLLVLRLDLRGKEVGQLPLQVGESGAIGGYGFRVAGYTRWSQLIFVKLTGIETVFFGFFLLLLGGVLHYFTPPCEILLEESGQGCHVAWQAMRFADFYAEEPSRLAGALGSERTDG